MTTSLARKYVADELIQWHTALFEPVHGASDVDFAVRTGDGQYVEIIVREPSSPDKPRSFVMKRFRPRSHLFIIAVAHGLKLGSYPLSSSNDSQQAHRERRSGT